MTNYRCILVDDEPIALDILSNYIQRLEGFTIVGRFTNPVKAFEALQQHNTDLLFLDIQMPELTGLELLNSLQHRPEVILTTAYREFALDGFELDVTDYLLKPIAFERFLKAIDKLHARKGRTSAPPAPEGPAAGQEATEAPFFVRADRKNVKVIPSEILYLESLKDYVRITTVSGTIMTKETLSHFEEILPTGTFLRVHRSFIVARDKITALSADGLEIGKQVIPVGRMYKLIVEQAVLG